MYLLTVLLSTLIARDRSFQSSNSPKSDGEKPFLIPKATRV